MHRCLLILAFACLPLFKVAGHKQVTLDEIQGYGHGMTGPAYPFLLRWMQQISPDPKPETAPQN